MKLRRFVAALITIPLCACGGKDAPEAATAPKKTPAADTAPAQAASGAVDFSEKVSAGEAWRVVTEQQRAMTVTAQTGQSFNVAAEAHLETLLSILDSDGGWMTRGRVEIQANRVQMTLPGQQPRTQEGPLHGQSFRVERTASGARVEGESQPLPAELAPVLARNFDRAARLLPSEPKRPGDQWSLAGKALENACAQFSDDPKNPGTGTVSFTFKEIADAAGPDGQTVRVAVLLSTWDIQAPSGGVPCRFTLKGESRVLLDSGMPLSQRLEGTLSYTGSMPGYGGQPIPVTGQGTIQVTMNATRTAGGKASPAAQAAAKRTGSAASASSTAASKAPAKGDAKRPPLAFTKYTDRTETAFTMLIPRDWQPEGGILRIMNPDAGVNLIGAKLQFAVTRPDGLARFQFYPEYTYYTHGPNPIVRFPDGHNYNGMIVTSGVASPEDYVLRVLLPNQRPQAQGVSVFARKDAPKLVEMHSAQAVSVPGITQVQVQAQLITVTYTEGGRKFREQFAVVMRYTQMLQSGDIMWGSPLSVSARAPDEEYDTLEPVFNTCALTFQLNPQWLAGEQRGQATRSKIMRDTQKEIHRIQQEIFENRQRTQAIIDDERTKLLREQEDYVDSRTNETVRLPNGYDNVWSDAAGNYYLTNDFHYDPNKDFQGTWRKIEVAPSR